MKVLRSPVELKTDCVNLTLCTDDPQEGELKRVQAKVGELTMKVEVLEWFGKKKASGRSCAGSPG